MTVSEVERSLLQHGIRADAYCLMGICGSDRYCLVRGSENWSVFFFERGERVDERHFQTEAEACVYFLDILLADPSVRHAGN